MTWISNFKKKPEKIFIVHGEDEAQIVLSDKIKSELNIDTIIPSKYDTFDFDAQKINIAEISNEAVENELINKIEEMKIENEKVLSKIQDILKQNKGNIHNIDGDLAAFNDAMTRLKRKLN